jgi:hypothetical protein
VRPDTVHRVDGSRFVNHGSYRAADITRLLRADGMHVGLQLSVWPETFSFTLSELVEAGIPVIGGQLGAQGERIDRCRLGWTVADIRDASAILAILDHLVDHPEALESATATMRREEALIPVGTMCEQYADRYREIANAAGRPAPVCGKGRETGMDVSRSYVEFLAARAEASMPEAARRCAALQGEVDALRERLRSPRHRIADTMANALQRVPVVWPIVARITERVLRRNADARE